VSRRRERAERGAATLLVVALLGALLFCGAALGVVQALFEANRHAQSAADLAALAGARALVDGADGCAAAGHSAARNGVALLSCDVSGSTVTVRLQAHGPRWLGQAEDVTATARAGPADAYRGPWAPLPP